MPQLSLPFAEILRLLQETQQPSAPPPPRQSAGPLVRVPQPPPASPQWARQDDPMRQILETIYGVSLPPVPQDAAEAAMLNAQQQSMAQAREAQPPNPGSPAPTFGLQLPWEPSAWRQQVPQHKGRFVLDRNATRPLLPLPPDPSQPPLPPPMNWYATTPSRPVLPGKLPPVLPNTLPPFLPPDEPLPPHQYLPSPPEQWRLPQVPQQPGFPSVPSGEIRFPSSPVPQTRPVRVLTPWGGWFLEVVPHSGGIAASVGKRF